MAVAIAAFEQLQKSLLDAKKDLETTNESIKKLTGQENKPRGAPRSAVSGSRGDPSESKRPSSAIWLDKPKSSGSMRAWSEADPERRKRSRPEESRSRLSGRLGSSGDLESPSEHKRMDRHGARSRLSDRLGPPVDRERPPRRHHSTSYRIEEDLDSEGEDGELVESDAKKPVQSSVIALPAPPRPKADPKEDEKSKKRNQRMFGFLMNTLRKFKDNETTAKTTEKERRRSEIEEKVEKTEELEKEAALMERRELYDQQKAQRIKIATIAKQMELAKNYAEWNAHDRLTQGYIETEASPHIFYLPKEHIPSTEELVAATRDKIEEKINKRVKEIDSFVETANSINAGQEVVGNEEGEVNGGSPKH